MQPIFVSPNRPLDELLRDAMFASAYVVYGQVPIVEEWLASDYRKTVRSAKPSMIERMKQDSANSVDWRAHGCALAYRPLHYDEFTKLMNRGQVSGWENKVLPMESAQAWERPSAVLYISQRVHMTPGKLTAQASHAAVLMGRDRGPASLALVNFAYRDSLPDEGYVIRDNGLTEIEPDTHTVTLVPAL